MSETKGAYWSGTSVVGIVEIVTEVVVVVVVDVRVEEEGQGRWLQVGVDHKREVDVEVNLEHAPISLFVT